MLNFNQGNQYEITFVVKNPDGTLKNLTGTQQLKYQLSKKKFLPALLEYTLASPQVVITDAVNGEVTITLPASTTKTLTEGNYYHEIWHVDAQGVPTTLLADSLRFSGRLIKE